MAHASRTFRVFVSSTFSDLVAERNALARSVFPALRRLCESHEYRFQAVDLRWGVSEEAALDQRAMPICLEELARCREVSPRPNFVILLGDRYGWRPAPFELPATVFEELLDRFATPADRELVHTWYRRDDNAVPSVYVLQPRSGEYERYSVWEPVERRLRAVLVEALGEASAEERPSWSASATEQEILAGALRVADASEHVFAFFRTIDGLPGDAAAGVFVDLDSGVRDREATECLADLKGRISAKLRDHVHEYRARWSSGATTSEHLADFCGEVELRLRALMEGEIGRLGENDPVEQERLAHESFRARESASFVGRESFLDTIEQYARGSRRQPLVLWGEAGSGKSALLSRAVERLRARAEAAVVVERFLGATAASTDGRSLLAGVCAEISRAYGVVLPTVRAPRDATSELAARLGAGPETPLPDLVGHLHLATAERPLVVVVDGLDQLSKVDGARRLEWLPAELPQHVRLILSTEPGDCLEALEAKTAAGNRIRLTVMSLDEARETLSRWLLLAGRRLEPDQESNLLASFERCGLPLHLRVAFDRARRWRSYERPPREGIGESVPAAVAGSFRDLADPRNHGRLLVGRVLALLAAARTGLTEDELLDLLSRDRQMMEEFERAAHHGLEEHRLPFVVWSRLRHDLGSFLLERRADGESVISFAHGQVRAAAGAAHLDGREGVERRRALIDYFQSNGTIARRASELTHQYFELENWDELGRTLSEPRLLAASWERSAGESMAYWMNLDARSFDVETPVMAFAQGGEATIDEAAALGEFLFRVWQWRQASNSAGLVAPVSPERLLEILRAAVAFDRAAERDEQLAERIQVLILELNSAGTTEDRRGRMAEILSLLEEQERVSARLDDTSGVAAALGGQARVLEALGRLEAALDRYGAQERFLTDSGDAEAASRSRQNRERLSRRMEGDSMATQSEAQAFAESAVREKMSTSIRFPEIPVYINAIYRAYGPPGPATMHLMMIVPERLSFRCSGCGPLDAEGLMREYNPRHSSMEQIAAKTSCPVCGRSEKVVLTYDPSRGGALAGAPPAKPWWKFW